MISKKIKVDILVVCFIGFLLVNRINFFINLRNKFKLINQGIPDFGFEKI